MELLVELEVEDEVELEAEVDTLPDDEVLLEVETLPEVEDDELTFPEDDELTLPEVDDEALLPDELVTLPELVEVDELLVTAPDELDTFPELLVTPPVELETLPEELETPPVLVETLPELVEVVLVTPPVLVLTPPVLVETPPVEVVLPPVLLPPVLVEVEPPEVDEEPLVELSISIMMPLVVPEVPPDEVVVVVVLTLAPLLLPPPPLPPKKPPKNPPPKPPEPPDPPTITVCPPPPPRTGACGNAGRGKPIAAISYSPQVPSACITPLMHSRSIVRRIRRCSRGARGISRRAVIGRSLMSISSPGTPPPFLNWTTAACGSAICTAPPPTTTPPAAAATSFARAIRTDMGNLSSAIWEMSFPDAATETAKTFPHNCFNHDSAGSEAKKLADWCPKRRVVPKWNRTLGNCAGHNGVGRYLPHHLPSSNNPVCGPVCGGTGGTMPRCCQPPSLRQRPRAVRAISPSWIR